VRQRTGRLRCARDQRTRRSGQAKETFAIAESQRTIPSYGRATLGILDELEEAPLIPVAALLLADASPREIVSRLRLNLAIRVLLQTLAESGAAS
jgi:hypothetical protein